MAEKSRDLTRTVLRGAGLATAGYVLTQVVLLGQYLALARLADPHEFGELAAGSILAGVGALLSESGMLAAVIQRRDRFDEAASTAVVATVLSGILMTALAAAGAPLVGMFFHSHTITLVALAMSGTVLVRQISIVPDALLQRRFSFVRRVVLEPVGAVLGAVVAIGATAAGYGVWGLVAGVYAGASIQAVCAWAFARWRPSLRLASFSMWRELAGFGRHVLLSEGIRRVDSDGRTAIIGRVLGPALLGQFAIAYRVGIQPLRMLVNSISYVLMPALASIADDRERFKAAALRGLYSLLVVSIPLNLMLVPFGRPATLLLFGDKWEPAASAVPWMCALGIGGAVLSAASETWKAGGQPHWLPRVHAVATVLMLGFTAWFVRWGLNGVSAALSVAYSLASVYGLYGMARALDARMRDLAGALYVPLLGGAIMLLVVEPLALVVDPSDHGLLAGLALLCGEAAVAAAVFFGVLAAFRPSDARRALGLGRRALSRRRVEIQEEGPAEPTLDPVPPVP
jgi:PST family polysaccharide transporter